MDFELDAQLFDHHYFNVTVSLVCSGQGSTFASVSLAGRECCSQTSQDSSRCPELMAVNVYTVDVESVMWTIVSWRELLMEVEV